MKILRCWCSNLTGENFLLLIYSSLRSNTKLTTLTTVCIKGKLDWFYWSSKSKHQVVHEQKFKDFLCSTCQVSVERSMLDLESEVQWFNTHWGKFYNWNFLFLHSKASDANIGIIVNFVQLRKTSNSTGALLGTKWFLEMCDGIWTYFYLNLHLWIN